ncbi:MAG: SCO family protein [Solirubrobacteraceae bacterium]
MSRPAAHRVPAMIALALVATLAFASIARADGDPASDVLLTSRQFIPADVNASAGQQAVLASLLQAAARGGFPIRVAVIPSDYDLGSVTVLWHRPRVYARFLGIELSVLRAQPVLVVMPDGFGYYAPGRSSVGPDRVLASIPIGSGSGGLLAATESAVRALASADGVRLAPGRRSAARGQSARGGGVGVTVVVAAGLVAALLLLGLAAGPALARRRRERVTPGRPATVAPQHSGRGAFVRRATGVGVLCGVAAAVPVLILTAPGRPGRVAGAGAGDPAAATGGAAPASAADAADAAAGTPFTWPEGSRRAPAFRLSDQNGRPVSIGGDRGRPVIITFIDPLCRNLCPLAAQVLDQVDRTLPPARRPAIIAVSVDVYANSRADLLQDFDRWRLVPQWRWAVGSPRQLAAVWSRYQVSVSVKTERIAGASVHFITHDEAAYLIDSKGFERALYFWPYYAQDVEQGLAHLSRS